MHRILGPEFEDDAGKSAIILFCHYFKIIIRAKEDRCFIQSTSSSMHYFVKI